MIRKTFRNVQYCLLAGLMAAGLATQSQASIQVNNLKLDLDASGEGGGATGETVSLQKIFFTGLAHNHIDSAGPLPAPGDLFRLDSIFTATNFEKTGGSLIGAGTTTTGKLLNTDWELTFVLSNPGELIVPINASNVNFVHKAAGTVVDGVAVDGILNIYLDGTPDANTSTGAGFGDGTLIARFEIIAGDGGVINLNTQDGSDDATFQLIWAKAGVLLDADTDEDLGLLIGSPVLLAMTDSNFDMDPNNTGPFSMAKPSAWPAFPGGFDAAGSIFDHFAEEDGSATFSIVPEPASAFIWLLLGTCATCRVSRRRKSRDR